jgi:hypothetical protein
MNKPKNTTMLHVFSACFVIFGSVFIGVGIFARSTGMHIQSRFQSGNYSIQRVMIKGGIFSENQLETERERILFKGIQEYHKEYISLCRLLVVDSSNCFLFMGVGLLTLGGGFILFVFRLKKQVGTHILNGLSVEDPPVNSNPQPPAAPNGANHAVGAP